MKPLRWFFNAGLRTVRAFVPEWVRADDGFAARWLPLAELVLYSAMDVRDRDHAVHVAKTVLRRMPEASSELVRAALLHDVGKADAPYRPWHRILAHLMPGSRVPAEPKLEGLRGAIQRRRYHPVYGAELIRAAGGSAVVADLVEHHHDPTDGSEGRLLKRIDGAT